MTSLRFASLLTLALAVISVAEVRSDSSDEVGVLSDGNRIKRQTPLMTVGTMTTAINQVYLTINGVNTLILNADNYETTIISVDENVQFVESANAVIVTNGSTVVTINGIDKFTYVSVANQIFSTTPDPNPTGPGILYVQLPNAFFSQSTFVNNFIASIDISSLGPIIQQVEVLTPTRITPNERIVLNVDNRVNGVADIADDILDLTGSSAFIISEGQTITYSASSQRLLVRTRSVIDQTETNIAAFSTVRSSGSGTVFNEYSSSTGSAPPISGPGILRIGNQGGQQVAFFSNVANVNSLISRNLVNNQIEFRVTNSTASLNALFPSSISGQSLISLNGAQVYNYPTATTVTRTGNTLEVRQGSQLLQSFTLDSGTSFGSFIGHQVQRTTGDASFDIPSGGASLLLNTGTNEAFVYPARNGLISTSINQAFANASITQPIDFATYSLSSDDRGFATLSAQIQSTGDEVEVVNVAPARVIDVEAGQSVRYSGNRLQILNSAGDTILSPTDEISTFTVNAEGNQFLTSSGSLSTTFGGPGRIYIDSNGRAFLTRNLQFQSAITRFVNDVSEPRIDVVRDTNDGLIYFQTGGENLFNLNGASSTAVNSRTSGIYRNNRIDFVNTFDVPANARVTRETINGDVRVRVRDPANPSVLLFDIPAPELYDFNDTPTRTDNEPTVNQITETSVNPFNYNNGVIYYSDRGALVSSSNTVTDGIGTILFGSGPSATGLQASIGNIDMIMNFTVADGSSIITYNTASTSRIPAGGAYYVSSSGGEAFYVQNANFNSRFPAIYAGLNPTTTTYNSTTGFVTISTGDSVIHTFNPVTTTLNVLGGTTSFIYANETIIFSDSTPQISGINTVSYFDGFSVQVFDRSTDTGEAPEFNGPGVITVIGDALFFTNDTNTANQVEQRVSSVMNTFRAPVLSTIFPRTFRSKFNQVSGGFPQTISLYEGADVTLTCTVLASNPPAMIMFYGTVRNESTGELEVRQILDTDSNYIVNQTSSTTAVLRIVDIMDGTHTINGSGTFTCVSENIVGRTSLSTTLNILPPQPPAIVTGYIPPLSTLRNSSERLISVRAGTFTNNEILFYPFFVRNITIQGDAQPNGVSFNDMHSSIIRTLHIGCRGEGLPKSSIRWYQVASPRTFSPFDEQSLNPDVNTNIVEIVDADRDDVLITVPREGRSVLTLELDQNVESCTRYICQATNPAGSSLGGVDICTQSYSCSAATDMLACSGTCGVGISAQRYTSCQQNFGDAPMYPVDFEDIPLGLFPLSPMLCGFDRPSCPVISYRYEVVNSTDCSVTCGVGSIMRTIECLEITNGIVDLTMTVNSSFCANQVRPSNVTTCSDNPPCPFWEVGAFGECSVTCGEGVRQRDVMCLQAEFNETTFELILDDDNNTILMEVNDSSICSDIRRPIEFIPCNTLIDCPFRWAAGAYGPCMSEGIFINCQLRDIGCEMYDPKDYFWPGEPTNDTFCDHIPRPNRGRNCNGLCCPGMWVSDRDGSCSVTCGTQGFQQYTNISCVARDGSGDVLEEYFCCDPKPREVGSCTDQPNCPGVCSVEPSFCGTVKIIGCANTAYASLASQCCLSCPKQATVV